MAQGSHVTIRVKSDTTTFQRTCRIIAKHMTALADELAELEDEPLIAVEPESASPEVQTPDVWCVRYGIEIRDPDGWRTPDAPSWDTPITLAEFQRRSAMSTARPVSMQTLGEIHDQISTDLCTPKEG